MSEHPKSAEIYPFPIEPAVVEGLFDSPLRPTHDEKWRELGPGDAAFVRAALIKAQSIRTEHGQAAGDAYLQGIADYHAAQARQAMAEKFRAADANSSLSRLTA